jgi:stage IV sporulation protein B
MSLDREAYSRSIVIPFVMMVFVAMLISFVAKISTYEPVLNVRVGDAISPEMFFPGFLTGNISCSVGETKAVDGEPKTAGELSFNNGGSPAVFGNPGKKLLEFRLFGFIPLSNIVVNVVEPVKVIPGGQSIGVMLHAKGVMVVGVSSVTGSDGKKTNPAADAGIMPGDSILSINGIMVKRDDQVREIVKSAKEKKLTMILKRGGNKVKVVVKPVYSSETGGYMVGLYVRDETAGVGTLSFYHPQSRYYGALGHVINDADTAMKIDLAEGKVVGASVKAIHPGRKGKPGEKVGMFNRAGNISGNIERNTPVGIFGRLDKPITNPFYEKALPVSFSYQIKKGPAEIMTVLEDNKVEKYSIEIQEILNPPVRDGKCLIIKVTDNRLLQKSGGIIQGMSGSPIIQNGMLVGAVTHVFVNDPTRGYGILAEWMLQEAGILHGEGNKSMGIRQKSA